MPSSSNHIFRCLPGVKGLGYCMVSAVQKNPFPEYIPIDGSRGLGSDISLLNDINRSVLMDSGILMMEGL